MHLTCPLECLLRTLTGNFFFGKQENGKEGGRGVDRDNFMTRRERGRVGCADFYLWRLATSTAYYMKIDRLSTTNSLGDGGGRGVIRGVCLRVFTFAKGFSGNGIKSRFF